MSKIRDFFGVYRIYRQAHRPVIAARIAYDIAFKGAPF